MAIVVARQLLPEGYGAFVFATSAAFIAGHLGSLGLPALMSRLIPTYRTREEWGLLRGLMRWGDRTVLVGCMLSLGLLAIIAFVPGIGAELRVGLVLSMILLLPTAFNMLRKSQLAGAKKPAAGLLFDQALAPASLALFAICIGVGDVGTAVGVMTVTSVVGFTMATVYLRRALPPQTWTATSAFEGRLWMATALPLLAGTTAKVFMNRMDILMLAPLANLAEVGLYGAAFRITYALTFPQVILMTVVTPLLSESIAKNNLSAMWRHFRIALLFAVITVVPVAVLLVIWTEQVTVLLYGEAFRGAAGTLRILALAQCCAGFSIPMIGLLIAAGDGKSFGVLSMIALALNGGLNLLLIPHYGAEGAAWATFAAFAFLVMGYGWRLWRLHRVGNIRSIVKGAAELGEPAE